MIPKLTPQGAEAVISATIKAQATLNPFGMSEAAKADARRAMRAAISLPGACDRLALAIREIALIAIREGLIEPRDFEAKP